MTTLTRFVALEIGLFLAALAFLLLIKLARGEIQFAGLLQSKAGAGSISPGRVQLLMATVSGAFFYLGHAVGSRSGLPELPTELVGLLAGSNAVYLGGKLRSHMRRREGG